MSEKLRNILNALILNRQITKEDLGPVLLAELQNDVLAELARRGITGKVPGVTIQ
jgi:hypothetical protein